MKTKMFFIIVVVFASAIFIGCTSKTETTMSKVLHEEAVVQTLIYTPPTHGSGISPGISMSGDLVISSISINPRAVYGVVFQCQHGNFAVQDSDQEHKNLWKKMKIGEKVNVSYLEIYKDYLAKVNGEWKLISRTLIDYDFLDANIIL